MGKAELHVLDDRVVQFVATDANRQRAHDAAEGDDGDLGGAATDVDDHVARGLMHRKAGADRRGHRLLDDEDLAGPGRVAGILDCALLDAGDARGDADDEARLGEVTALVHLLDEVAQHALRGVEVGDDAVLQRTDRHDVAGRASDHALGL
jgi:hypothetical protein